MYPNTCTYVLSIRILHLFSTILSSMKRWLGHQKYETGGFGSMVGSPNFYHKPPELVTLMCNTKYTEMEPLHRWGNVAPTPRPLAIPMAKQSRSRKQQTGTRSSSSSCGWYGITCDAISGMVTELNLYVGLYNSSAERPARSLRAWSCPARA